MLCGQITSLLGPYWPTRNIHRRTEKLNSLSHNYQYLVTYLTTAWRSTISDPASPSWRCKSLQASLWWISGENAIVSLLLGHKIPFDYLCERATTAVYKLVNLLVVVRPVRPRRPSNKYNGICKRCLCHQKLTCLYLRICLSLTATEVHDFVQRGCENHLRKRQNGGGSQRSWTAWLVWSCLG